MKTTLASTLSSQVQSSQLTQHSDLTITRVGFWSALIFTLSMTAYNIAYFPMVSATVGRVWTNIESYAPTVNWIEYIPPSFGLVALPAFLVMLICLHVPVGKNHEPWSLLGVSFGALFVGLVVCLYLVTVTSLRRSLETGEWDGLSPLVWGNPNSIIWALDYLGWGFFLGLSNIFTALGSDHTWTKRLLMLNGVASLLLFFGFLADILWMQYPGLVTWTVVLPAVGILVTNNFWHQLHHLENAQ